ncbi:uncharacterized protein LOC134787042 [Penaeus indicus]|uniref:uncharacterized protein LOC134787042 n=1 Tax=Penaeus indicus TaxID=29960 RepID=UPI00300D1CD0
MEGRKMLAVALQEKLQWEGGVLRGASLLTETPHTWHLLLQDPFSGTDCMLLKAEKGNYILHVCCRKRKFPYISNKRNAHMVKLRRVCFDRVKEIIAGTGWASVPASKNSVGLTLQGRLNIHCVNICLMLHFAVHKNSLVATCPHKITRKRAHGEISSSVTYFTALRKGVVHCKKAELPTEMGVNAGATYTSILHNDDEIARTILRRVDERVKQTVRRNAETVRLFAERLQKNFHAGDYLAGADIMHAGSAYEGLTVKPKTDFDVIVVLALKCLEDGFEVIRDESMFFKLKTRNGFVLAEKLQKFLFKELTECVGRTKVDGASIRCREGLASLDVEIKTKYDKISVDLSPQIPVRTWGRCPDLVSLASLPRCLRHYIDVLNRNKSPVMFFSPAVPGHHRNQDVLCNVSFSMLEKTFLRNDATLRDSVRLVKATAVCLDWKEKFGLKSFHIKRVAIKYSDELEGLTLWNGYKQLLRNLMEELTSTHTFDGFFVSNQVTYKKKPERVYMLKEEIKQVITWSSTKLMQVWSQKARRP